MRRFAPARDSHTSKTALQMNCCQWLSVCFTLTSSYVSILKGNVCTMIVVMLSLKTLYTHRDINTQSSIKLTGHGQYV